MQLMQSKLFFFLAPMCRYSQWYHSFWLPTKTMNSYFFFRIQNVYHERKTVSFSLHYFNDYCDDQWRPWMLDSKCLCFGRNVIKERHNCSDSKVTEVGTVDEGVLPTRITKCVQRQHFLSGLIIDLLGNGMFPCWVLTSNVRYMWLSRLTSPSGSDIFYLFIIIYDSDLTVEMLCVWIGLRGVY
jgi:hypothetical protein